MVRLWPNKIDFSLPVILYYLSFQCDASVVVLIVLCLGVDCCSVSILSMLSYFSYVWVTEWPPIGKMATHSAVNMFSQYKYPIVNLVFSHLGFWNRNFFLTAPFPVHCLLLLSFVSG